MQYMSKVRQSDTRHQALLRLFGLAAAGSIALTGCVAGKHEVKRTAPPSSSSKGHDGVPPSKMHAIQSHTFITNHTYPLQVDILSLARLKNNKLKLQLRMTNTGQQNETLPSLTFGFNEKNPISEIAIIDGSSMKAYFPLTSTQGNVMESGYESTGSIGAGASIYPTVFFPTPNGATVVDITTPSTPLFTDIPIRGTASIAKGEPDPNRVQLKSPRIENITNLTEDLNGDKSVEETGGREKIDLNADVLFALNKAKLTSKAKSIISSVADQIDKATTTTIKVDGYTDNSGNDAINNPLSRRRAAAVAAELKKLVSRSGVTYQTAGHGSADPVASNDTAAGRQKNRRVTVTIGK